MLAVIVGLTLTVQKTLVFDCHDAGQHIDYRVGDQSHWNVQYSRVQNIISYVIFIEFDIYAGKTVKRRMDRQITNDNGQLLSALISSPVPSLKSLGLSITVLTFILLIRYVML